MASDKDKSLEGGGSPHIEDLGLCNKSAPFLLKICYGLSIFFDGATMSLLAAWGPYYFSDILKIKASVLAPGVALIVATYGLSQPLTGTISDLIGDRCACIMSGRRRPFLVFGSLAAAIGVVMCFNPPTSFFDTVDHGPGVMFYIVTAGCVCMGGVGAFEIMVTALLPILAKTNYQRKELAMVSGLSYAIGFASASLLPAAWDAVGGNGSSSAMELDIQRAKFSGLSYFFGVGLLSTTSLLAARTHEPPTSNTHVQVHGCDWFREIPSFLTWPSVLYLMFYVLATASTGVLTSSMPFFAKFVLMSERAFLWAPVISSCGPFLGAPIWIYLIVKLEKKTVLSLSLLSLCFACIVAIMAKEGEDGTPVLFVSVGIFAVGIGGYVCAPGAIQPDVCDYDELRSQKRRDGQLLGFWFCSGRMGAGIIMGAALAAMSATGFDSSLDKQPAAAKQAIRYVGFVVPAIGYLCAAVVMTIYPISHLVLQEIQGGIGACKDGSVVQDPLSKHRTVAWKLAECKESRHTQKNIGVDAKQHRRSQCEGEPAGHLQGSADATSVPGSVTPDKE